MTPEERAYLRKINARVARLQPEEARAWRLFYQLLEDEVGSERAARLIAEGRVEGLITNDAFDRISTPVRAQLPETMKEGFRLTLLDIPGAILKNQPQIFFNVLNPRVTQTIEQLESRTLDTLKERARQAVRETVGAGLAKGHHPDKIARDLRIVIGLSEQQRRFVRNIGDDLDNLDARYFTRQLRDKRYDARVRKAIASETPISAADRETIVSAYARKYTKYNTEINTRIVTLDAYRLSQWEAYASAIDREIYEPDEIEKVWMHFDPQENPRPKHQEWHGTIVGFYQAFPDDQQQAGLGCYGCHCWTEYRVKRRAGPLLLVPKSGFANTPEANSVPYALA